MAMTTPITQSVNAFTALTSHTFSFVSVGGDQVVKNEIKIIDNNSGEIVYTNIQETYQFSQTIPSNTLVNGVYYAVAFRTYDVNDNVSEWSNYVPFYCYSTPTLSLNINYILNSASYNVVLTYNQEQGELLDYAKFSLYTIDGVLVQESKEIYNTNVPPLTINYMLNGMENGQNYKLIVTTISVNGTVVTERVDFSVKYTQPNLSSLLDLEPKNCEGYIDISSNFISNEGITNPNIPNYVEIGDNIELDNAGADYDITHTTTSRWVKWQNGFKIPKNFTLKYWFTPTNNNATILKLCNIGETECLELKFYRGSNYDYINLTTLSGTNITKQINHINGTDQIFVWVRVNDNVWDFRATTLSRSDTIFNWNDDNNNIQYNILSDLPYIDESYEGYHIPNEVQNALTNEFDKVLIGTTLSNFISITSDISSEYTTDFPIFDFNTIIQCDFDNNVNGGNVSIVVSQLTKIKIKRRDINTLNWVTIYEKDINSEEDINIKTIDSNVPFGIEQTYAIVPILQDGEEGAYILNKVTPNWQGVFISNNDKIFKLYNSVIYDTTAQNKKIGMLEPIGRKYPIIIENSENDYKSGGLQAQLYGYNFENTRKIDRNDVVKQTQDFINFIKDGSTKMITDWNGNIVMCKLISSPTISYVSSYGNGITNVNFTWAEQGQYNVEQDLIDNNLYRYNVNKNLPNNDETHVIGVHVDFQNMKFDRIADSENLTMGADFNKFNMYGGRKRCLLTDNGVVIAYNDGTKYICNDTNKTIITLENGESGLLTTEVTVDGTVYPIGTQIQVMVEQPKFYYKVVPIKLDKQTNGVGYHLRSANYYVSDYKYYGFKIHPAFVSNGKENDFIYMSAYEGCTFDTSASAYKLNDAQDVDWTNDVLASICGAKPTSGLTQNGATRDGFRTIASKRGLGWSQQTIQATTATELLFLVEYASFNMQSKIGIGVTNKTEAGTTSMTEITGATTTLGNATGFVVNTNGWNVVSYRGQENPFGNIWKWIDGINVYNYGEGSVYIADHDFADNIGSDPYQDAGITIASTTGFVSAFAYNEDFDWLFIASETNGNSSLPVGDYFYQNKATSAWTAARLGGGWNNSSSAGGFCWSVDNDSSIHNRGIGGRLLYVPDGTDA